MLHVEHRHVLVNDDLEQAGIALLDECRKLLPIHVVAGDQALQTRAAKQFGRELVDHVERKIADQRGLRRLVPEEVEAGQIADQQHVAVLPGNLPQQPFLAGLEDPQRGEADRSVELPCQSHRVTVAAHVFKVAIDQRGGRHGGLGPPHEHAHQLLHRPGQHVQLRRFRNTDARLSAELGPQRGQGVLVDPAAVVVRVALLDDRRHDLPPQIVEHALGHERRGGDLQRHFAETER